MHTDCTHLRERPLFDRGNLKKRWLQLPRQFWQPSAAQLEGTLGHAGSRNENFRQQKFEQPTFELRSPLKKTGKPKIARNFLPYTAVRALFGAVTRPVVRKVYAHCTSSRVCVRVNRMHLSMYAFSENVQRSAADLDQAY